VTVLWQDRRLGTDYAVFRGDQIGEVGLVASDGARPSVGAGGGRVLAAWETSAGAIVGQEVETGSPQTLGASGAFASVHVNAAGTGYAVWNTPAWGMGYAGFENGVWSSPGAAGFSNAYCPSVAVDAQGNPHVAFGYGTVSHVSASGGAWGAPEAVQSSSAYLPILTAGPNALHLAYVDTSEGNSEVYYRSRPFSGCSVAISGFQATDPEGYPIEVLNTGAGGAATFSGAVSATLPVSWVIDILSPYPLPEGVSGEPIVATYTGTGLTPAATWEGRDASLALVPPGYYTARLRVNPGAACGAEAQASVWVESETVCSLYATVESSVNLASGALGFTRQLFTTRGGALPAGLVLAYRGLSGGSAHLGLGWTHGYDVFVTPSGAGSYALYEGDGNRTLLVDNGQAYTPRDAAWPILRQTADGAFTLEEKGGLTRSFDAAGRLTSVADRNDNALVLAYDAAGRLATATDPAARVVGFAYRADGRLVSVTAPDGSVYELTYTIEDLLSGIVSPDGSVWSYAYDSIGRLVAKTDPLGHRIAYAYDTLGRLVQAQDPQGNARTLAYDPAAQTTVLTEKDGGAWTYRYAAAAGVLLEKEDPQGGRHTYAYDAARNLLSSADPSGAVTAYTYDDAANLLAETDPLGQVTTYTYTAQDELKSVTDPEERTTLFAYDARGNLTATTDPAGAVTAQEYHARGQVTRRIGPNGEATAYTYDAWGNLASVTDPTGATTQMLHDVVGNLLSRTDPNGQTTSYAYDLADRLVAVTGPDGAITAYAYDLGGNRVAQTDPNGQTTLFTYDANGRLVTTTDPAGGVTTYTYGGAGCPSCGPGTDRLTSVTDPNGRTTSYEYDLLGRRVAAIDPTGNRTSFAYDARGNLVVKTDAEGRITTFAYDALGRRTAVTDPLGATVHTEYTATSQVASVTDPIGVTTTYAYDTAGRLFQTTSPDAGTTSYTYNADGTLHTKTDPNGIVTTYAYDAAGRLTEIAFPDPSQNITHGYDALTAENGWGRLTSTTDPSGATVYHYDAQGRITREEKAILGVSYTTRYAYDLAGNLVEMTYPSGRTVTYPRDAKNRPTSVTATLGTPRVLASEIAYDPAGNRTRLALGNGLAETWAYDPANRVAAITVPGIAALAYTYDRAGNILAITDTVNPSSSKTYAYDALARLTGATGPWGSLAWTYDANGNRLSETRNGSVTSYGYQGNRLATVSGATTAAYQYDLAGNNTADGWRSFVYNQNQRLIQVRLSGGVAGEYTYNAKQQRVTKQTGPAALQSASPQNIVYHYDLQGSLITETTAAGQLLTDYVYAEGRPLAMIRKQAAGEETFTYHTDHLGSPILLTDKLGKVVWNLAQDPFGNPVPSKGRHGAYIRNVENNLRFPGQYYDAESGLHQNWYRDYAPRVGRYLEPDPIRSDTALYPYANNAPTVLADPSGLSTAGDVVFFNWSSSSSAWPRHAAIVTRVDHNMVPTHAFGAWGDTMTFHEVDLTKYNNCGIQKNIIGTGDMQGLQERTVAQVMASWGGRLVAPGWDGDKGLVCIDVVTAKDGYGGTLVRNAMASDYGARPSTYKPIPIEGGGAKTPNPESGSFYRANPWLQQFYINTSRYVSYR